MIRFEFLIRSQVFAANLPELISFLSSSTLLAAPALIALIVPTKSGKDVFEYILIITILVGQLIYFILIFPVYNEYKWEIFKRVGTDPSFIGTFHIHNQINSSFQRNLQQSTTIQSQYESRTFSWHCFVCN